MRCFTTFKCSIIKTIVLYRNLQLTAYNNSPYKNNQTHNKIGHLSRPDLYFMSVVSTCRELDVQAHKSSALAEMGDRGHNRQGRKVAAVPHSRGAGSPSNTMWPGPRSTSVQSGVFIHPAVWPQQTWAKWGVCPF